MIMLQVPPQPFKNRASLSIIPTHKRGLTCEKRQEDKGFSLGGYHTTSNPVK
jgi:hypothetical protein